MVTYLGDYDTTETVHIPFNTFSSDDPSASVTITNLAAGDVEIHKDGSVTQRASDAGVTVSIDFDGVTGNHVVAIDLSDNSDAGFYAAGSRYMVRIEGTTVDGATINAWIGMFSIGCTLRPTTAGRKLDVTATGAAGIDWANVENPTTAVDLSATAIDLCDTTTTNTDMRGTDGANTMAQSGDSYARLGAPAGASIAADLLLTFQSIGAKNAAAATGDPSDAESIMQYIKQLINILIGTSGIAAFPAEAAPANAVSLAEVIRAIHADVTGLNGSAMRGTDGANTTTPPTVGEIQTELEENGASILDTLRDDLADGGRLDLLIDAIKAVTDALPDAGALTSIAQEATIGSPAGADLVADIAAIKAETALLDGAVTEPTDGAVGTLTESIANMVYALWKRFYCEHAITKATGVLSVKNKDDSEFIAQATTDDATVQEVGKAT